MKAAVIGAGGFLGRHLCETLLSRNWLVTAIDLRPPELVHPRLTTRHADITQTPIPIAKGTDAVFFLAQSLHYRDFPHKAEDLFGINAWGPVKAAAAAVAAGVRFFCYTSTGSVYAPSFIPLAESMPLNRDEPYALSKLFAEEALDLFRRHLVAISLRLFALFGPDQVSMLPATIYKRIRNGEPITLEGIDGEVAPWEGLRLSFTYVRDCATCMAMLADLALKGKELPKRLNVAAPEAVSIRQFAEAMGRCLSIAPRFEYSQNRRRFNLIADTRLLQDVLSPSFTPLEEAVYSAYAKAAGKN